MGNILCCVEKDHANYNSADDYKSELLPEHDSSVRMYINKSLDKKKGVSSSIPYSLYSIAFIRWIVDK
jgi:hypothetical protein